MEPNELNEDQINVQIIASLKNGPIKKPEEVRLLLANVQYLQFLILIFKGKINVDSSKKIKSTYNDVLKVKKYEDFDNDFYHQLMYSFFQYFPENAGIFNSHMSYSGLLAEVFNNCIEKMTPVMLDKPEIKFCFSLLSDCFTIETHEKPINSLINLIICAHRLFPDVYKEDLEKEIKV